MEASGKVTLTRIPQEVWEIIFSHLTTSDMLNFCKAFPEHNYFAQERNFVKTFDISGNYTFCDTNLLTYMKENIAYKHIRTLNINKLYWVGLEDLRILIRNLTGLEELLALNTKLGLRTKDVFLYGKLKTLAVTVEGSQFINFVDSSIYRNNLYLLRKLCLHILVKHPKAFTGMCKLFSELFALEELWICDTDDGIPTPIKYDALIIQLRFLRRLVIKSRVNIPFLDYKPFGLAKYFETRRFKSIVMRYEGFRQSQIVPFRDVQIFEPYETQIEHAWSVLRKFRSEMPFDDKAHREIYLTKQIKHLKFDQLNFFHNKCFCTKEYVRATLDFLTSENSRDLSKLSIKSCVLQRKEVNKGNTLARLERQYPILDVIENCPKVSTLELMMCTSVEFEADANGNQICNVTILQAYPYVCKWENLERFTLEVPVHLDGAFLVDLVKSCKKLKFLRVISYSTNEFLNRNIYRALPHANILEDFCFDNRQMNIPKLFESLNQLRSRTLRRLCINCIDTEALQSDCESTIGRFLSANSQLLFLFLTMSNKPKHFVSALQKLVTEHEKKHPAKNFFVKKDQKYFVGTGSFPIPGVHMELLNYDTEVSMIDFYKFS